MSQSHPYYRRPRKPFVVVVVTSDVEPSFEDFDTYEEARDAAEGSENKAWIIGPEWVEDHS